MQPTSSTSHDQIIVEVEALLVIAGSKDSLSRRYESWWSWERSNTLNIPGLPHRSQGTRAKARDATSSAGSISSFGETAAGGW